MKRKVTVWYYDRSFDGVERTAGPIPEEIEVSVPFESTDWSIKQMAARVFENEYPLAEIKDVEVS